MTTQQRIERIVKKFVSIHGYPSTDGQCKMLLTAFAEEEANKWQPIKWRPAWSSDPLTEPTIDLVLNPRGPARYAVRKLSSCLNKDGEWEYEPSPSNRDDEFMERCRFATFQEASDTLSRHLNSESFAPLPEAPKQD